MFQPVCGAAAALGGPMADSTDGMPGAVACGTALDRFEGRLSAMPGAGEDETASAGGPGRDASRIAGSATGAANHGDRTGRGVAGIFCGNSVAFGGFAAAAFPAGFCVPFPPAAGTVVGAAPVDSWAGGVASGPNNAAKLAEAREPELAWPNKPANAGGAALGRIADSMALVTMNSESKVRADRKAHSPWMHLGHQPRDARRSGVRREKRPWNQGNQNLADGMERRPECDGWASAAQTRQNLTIFETNDARNRQRSKLTTLQVGLA